MVEAANIVYTENQILDIRLTVILNTRDFEKALGDWENLPTTDKIWARLKTHFTVAQQQVKAIRCPTTQQAGYHHAKHLAQQLSDDMQHRDNDIMSILHTTMDSNSVTPSLADSDLITPTPLHHQANVTQADTNQLEILKLLKRIQSEMSTNTQPQPPNNANTRNNTARTQRSPRKTPDNASLPRKKTDKYCWTHGAAVTPQ